MRIHRYLSHLIPLLLAIFTLPTLSAEEFEYEGFKFSTNPGDTTCTLIQGDYQHLTEAIIRRIVINLCLRNKNYTFAVKNRLRWKRTHI